MQLFATFVKNNCNFLVQQNLALIIAVGEGRPLVRKLRWVSSGSRRYAHAYRVWCLWPLLATLRLRDKISALQAKNLINKGHDARNWQSYMSYFWK